MCNSTYKSTNFPLENPTKQVNFENKNKIEHEKPLLFNPIIDNPLDLFQVKLILNPRTGKGELHIEPLDTLHKNSYLYKKARTTIDLYNLNNHIEHDISRYNRLSNRFGDVHALLETYKKFKENPTISRNEIKFLKMLKNIRVNKKLGIAEFIIKGQYKQ